MTHSLPPEPLPAQGSTELPSATCPADPYLWLEEVHGEAALAWVRERNAASRPLLEAQPDFLANRERFKTILDASERIPQISREGDWLYNFWRDLAHPRGLWRRTTLESYRQAEPRWELLLDLDALAATEQENWVWSRAKLAGGRSSRCLIALSRGGADATVLREFDLARKEFLADGFALPEAKSSAEWLDENTLLIGTDLGPGSLTDSGYPREIRLWRRGHPLSQAQTIYQAQAQDVSAFASVDKTPGFERVVLGRSPDFYTNELVLMQYGLAMQDGPLQPIAKPLDAELNFWRDQVLIKLRSDWAPLAGGPSWPGGSLLIGPAQACVGGPSGPADPKLLQAFCALFTPSATRSLENYSLTASQVLLEVLENVASRLLACRLEGAGSARRWVARELPAPFPGTLQVRSLYDSLVPNDPLAESYLLSYVDFLTPDSLYLGHAAPEPDGATPSQPGAATSALGDTLERLKSRPAYFDTAGMRVEQCFARSADGTSVPYFVVWPAGATASGRNPTLLYGYGGFEVAMQPWYSPGWGLGWLAKGGVLAVANIRGGGEFGPAWHQAATLSCKQKSYDDFIAVAEALIASGVSRPEQLGIQGGSNGGLLVGAVMMQRPELFNAVVCQVPLLDMRRYHQLLAGASWMAEYGNPDEPADWAVIARYSPYQNLLQRGAALRLPKVFFVTSTRDDRVHPGHARKMAAAMLAQGHSLLYYENIEGGHGGAADNAQLADRQALEMAFLWQQLGPAASAPGTPTVAVQHNRAESRFEAWVVPTLPHSAERTAGQLAGLLAGEQGGQPAAELCELNYQRRQGVIWLVHTGVPRALEGRGIAAALVLAALSLARAEGLKVVPSCSYVAAYIRRHAEWADLLAR